MMIRKSAMRLSGAERNGSLTGPDSMAGYQPESQRVLRIHGSFQFSPLGNFVQGEAEGRDALVHEVPDFRQADPLNGSADRRGKDPPG